MAVGHVAGASERGGWQADGEHVLFGGGEPGQPTATVSTGPQ